ncbi:hypothetical protein SAMN05216389_10393 [Oceanobacillus limi]|uniref:Uncharacterized protein n=1 Tax=Oceanobacillus limi TaxID=930131 RepID=A0A1I0A5Y9_9BACI|nr:hypothetical protein [Oceanobacillus limi]SES89587.1 hypothetical protein SAMN05216389_10393 [Oceanobacillus limi]
MLKKSMRVLLVFSMTFLFYGSAFASPSTSTSSEITPQACFLVPPCDYRTIGF